MESLGPRYTYSKVTKVMCAQRNSSAAGALPLFPDFQSVNSNVWNSFINSVKQASRTNCSQTSITVL
jgi:hypothetical protein